MKLTQLERYAVYCIMHDVAKNPYVTTNPYDEDTIVETGDLGLCWLYKCVFGSSDLYYYAKTLLPELYAKSTKPFRCWGFYNWEERIAALQQCIEETHPDEEPEYFN